MFTAGVVPLLRSPAHNEQTLHIDNRHGTLNSIMHGYTNNDYKVHGRNSERSRSTTKKRFQEHTHEQQALVASDVP